MKKIAYILLFLFLHSACSHSQNDFAASEKTTIAQGGIADNEMDVTERKIIKSSDLLFSTNDNLATYQVIKTAINKFGAYTTGESTYNYNSKVGYDMYVRVPSAMFDSIIGYILTNAPVKELDSKSTQLTDVTEEFIDVEARMKVKKETELKFLELLQRANNLTETLEVQRQLTELRAEIESLEGRQKYLSSQVSYSNIHISFYEEVALSSRFFSEFGNAFSMGWQMFLQVLTFLANLWVFILLAIGGFWLFRRYRKNKAKSVSKQEN